MLLTNLQLTKSKIPYYKQLVLIVQEQIKTAEIKPNDKLPSIRKLSEALKISRTTVETAYNQLVSDGYLLIEPQKDYFAANQLQANKKNKNIFPPIPRK